MMMLFWPYSHGLVGGGCCFGDVGLTNHITLGVGWRGSVHDMAWLLAHEYAHVWANRWYYESRPAGGSWIGGATWAHEGIADLLAFEVLRREAAMPFDANAGDALFEPGTVAHRWSGEFSPSGDFLSGYTESSGFLRDVVQRLVRKGMPIDDAFRTVARHAVEGWFGFDPDGQQRTGLAAALRAAVGGPWEPADAMRLWMLTQAADDLTPNPELQNVFRRGVSAWVGNSMRVGTREGRGSFRTSVAAGGVGAVRLLDRAGGATFETNSETAQLVWGIVRVR